MGLYDRHYMREQDHRGTAGNWSVTSKLMISIVAAFVLQTVAGFHLQSLDISRYLALSLEGLSHGFLWQLLTFQFLHAGLLHLVFNVLTIYFFGKALEETFGGRRMLQLYFASGVFGGLLQMLAALLAREYFGGSVVGASAGAFGLVAAFATLFPERLLTLLVMFVIPVSLRARTLLWISVGIALLGLIVPTDNIAHAAHLGGIIAGCAFIRLHLGEHPALNWRFNLPKRARPVAKVAVGRPTKWSRPQPIEPDLPPEEFISKEVDPILDKISQHGIHSLTERERKILEKARERMAKR